MRKMQWSDLVSESKRAQVLVGGRGEFRDGEQDGRWC